MYERGVSTHKIRNTSPLDVTFCTRTWRRLGRSLAPWKQYTAPRYRSYFFYFSTISTKRFMRLRNLSGYPSRPHLCEEIASAGDALVTSTRSLSKAAHMFIAHWGKFRAPTTIMPKGMNIFKGIADDDVSILVLNFPALGQRRILMPHRPDFPRIRTIL